MKNLVLSLCVLSVFAGEAQKSPVLFTVDGREQVTAEEFTAVFNKNREIGEQIDPKTPEEYLQLYIDFKLKVREAKDSAMHLRESFIRELQGYRAQLAKPYLTDQMSEEALVKEAFERMQEDVKASHVMIYVEDFKNPADTANAWNEISDAYEQVRSGRMSFEEAAQVLSDDSYSAKKKGSLGWFNVFGMVYEFESAVYGLEVEEISKVFKTPFGYHFARLDAKRPARGKATVAHLMLMLPEDAEPSVQAETERKIKEIHGMLTSGTLSFGNAVLQFSEDKTTKGRGGLLPEFGLNDMVGSFEDAAFALQDSGAISAPVRTPYGWHIIQLVGKKPLRTFSEMETELRGKIKRDVRAEVSQDRFIESLAKEYDWQLDERTLKRVTKELDGSVGASWSPSEKQLEDARVIARYADSSVTVGDLMGYIGEGRSNFSSSSSMRFILEMYLEMYAEKCLLAYEDAQLENKYPEFRLLMNEYRDGILLFDLTDQRIWSRSMSDSLGLFTHFEANKEDYRWDIRHRYTIYDCASKRIAKKVRKKVLKGTADSLLLAKYNKKSILNLQIERKTEENAAAAVADLMALETGPITEVNGRYQFIHVTEVLPAGYKELEEVKGLVAADYQKLLETEWVKRLRSAYPVVIDQEVRDAVILELSH